MKKKNGNKSGRKSGSRAKAVVRRSRTAKPRRYETAKSRQLVGKTRTQTANRAPRQTANETAEKLRNANAKADENGIRWSRPSPRSGVRLPLGAHPWNTGGKKGRSGPGRVGAPLFGMEYIDQPLTARTSERTSEIRQTLFETAIGNSEENNDNLTKPDVSGEIGRSARPRERVGSGPWRDLEQTDLGEVLGNARVEQDESSPSPPSMFSPGGMTNGLFRSAGTRVENVGSEVAHDWDPFN